MTPTESPIPLVEEARSLAAVRPTSSQVRQALTRLADRVEADQRRIEELEAALRGILDDPDFERAAEGGYIAGTLWEVARQVLTDSPTQAATEEST
jgi:hypothetical protein